jgi:DNA invertase Pin-like site-specific DNA recombinase
MFPYCSRARRPMGPFAASFTRGVGRPKVDVKPEQVGELRIQGMSWRKIAKALKIGTATAMRLFGSIADAPINRDR